MTIKDYKTQLQANTFAKDFAKVYVCGSEDIAYYTERCLRAIAQFQSIFSYDEDQEILLVSAPGRTELCGNHTDHQGGHVLAASVHLDILAVVAKREDFQIHLQSEGMPLDSVDISNLHMQEAETNSSQALIRGIANAFAERGYTLSGFDAYTTSDILRGSGLSSSAAFEILVGTIFNSLCARSELNPIELAKIGQYAENVYFGKPCGLMDQMACAVGGVVGIDFADKKNPIVEKTSLELSKIDRTLCIIDTGADHADLTDAYASIPREMGAVAHALGVERLCEASLQDVIERLPALREQCGDRAILRAMHYYSEDVRAKHAFVALCTGNLTRYLDIIRESGASSFAYLQNISTFANPLHQEVALALAFADLAEAVPSVQRVHGGGFAGTIQCYFPTDSVSLIANTFHSRFRMDCVTEVRIRPVGGVTFPLPLA